MEVLRRSTGDRVGAEPGVLRVLPAIRLYPDLIVHILDMLLQYLIYLSGKDFSIARPRSSKKNPPIVRREDLNVSTFAAIALRLGCDGVSVD